MLANRNPRRSLSPAQLFWLALATGAVVLIVATAGPVRANTRAVVSNFDDRAHTITVYEGDSERQFAINSNEERDDVCSSSCEIGLEGDDNIYEIVGTDRITIEGGQLLFQSDEETPDTDADTPADPEPEPEPEPDEDPAE